jgi:Ca2+/Na+ antiporter
LFEFNFRTIKFLRFNLIMTVFFLLTMTIITSNLGISNRQKWMVFLPLLTVFLYARYYLKKLKSSK